jgi:hypothetical protein
MTKRKETLPSHIEAPPLVPLDLRPEELLHPRATPRHEAIRSTQVKHYSAAVAEWLHDHSYGKKEIRSRFEHGLSNASDETLCKASAIIEAIAAAIESNDADAFAEIEDTYGERLGFKHINDLISRACTLIGSAAAELREARELRSKGVTQRVTEERDDEKRIIFSSTEDVPSDAYIAELTLTMLGSLDDRFKALDITQAIEGLAAVASDGQHGPGMKKAGAVLVDLALQCNGFGFCEKNDPHNSVKTALSYARKKGNKRG